MENYIEERTIEPINILIVFLLGIAAIVFIFASINSFDLRDNLQRTLIILTCVLYVIALFAFLYPKKTRTKLPEDKIVHVEKEVIKEVPKHIIKYREKPVIKEVEKIIEKPMTKLALLEVEKKEKPKSKYVGSSYKEIYHLRNCRFSGAIKKRYLIEEDDKKYFKLRGYEPCKVCNPDKA